MVKFNCFAASFGKKENFKKKVLNTVETNKGNGTVQMKLEHMVNSLKENGFKLMYFNVSLPFGIQETSTCKVKVVEDENSNSTRPESAEACYEQGPSLPMGKDLPDSDLQTREINNENETEASIHKTNGSSGSVDTETNSGSERDEAVEVAQSGHISDPGVGKGAFRGSPKLKRSHSHVETLDLLKKIANRLPPKSQSLEELQDSTESGREEVTQGIQASPLSLMTSCSTDMVMLERLSSSQLLPSRSRRLWWKLFLWSHRNLHKPGLAKSMKLVSRDASNRKDGYRSDTLEASCVLAQKNNQAQASKSDLLGSLSDESKNRSNNSSSGIQDPNQWVAFPMESSSCLSRVDEWVNSLNAYSILSFEDHIVDAEGEMGDNIDYPLSPEIKGLPEKAPLTTRNSNDKLAEEVLQANNIIQSMNSSSAMAHIAGIGLKVIPNISLFASLRSVNLSGNFIAHIVPGSLPKSLHTLNLSRNKISAIEGLRELTRLRLLDLSYNRISRIGRGLSHCTFIKELYLAGNKISDVEGLHRLLKLTVLDLSFNKITTAKALGQLVANYNSLLALNLVGNPVQSNIGDDQLRKAVSGLLPQLAYLNKQPIKQKGAREVAMDSVAKAALGNGRLNPRKKMSRRLSQGSTSTKGRVSEGVGHRARHRSKSTNHQIPQPMRRLST